MRWRTARSEEEAVKLSQETSAPVGIHFAQTVRYSEEGMRNLGRSFSATTSCVHGLYFDEPSTGSLGLSQLLIEAVLMSSRVEVLWVHGGLTDGDVVQLGEGLLGNDKLKELKLESFGLGIEGPKALAMFVAASQGVAAVSLVSLNLPPLALKAMAVSLQVNHTLLTLDLSHNRIDEEGVDHLVEGLLANSILETLNLGFNSLGATGAGVLAEGLQSSSGLTDLDLSSNDLRDRGTLYLSDGLKRLTGLRHLNLKRNKISDISAKGVLGLLDADDCLLETLDLSINLISDGLVSDIGELISYNYSLRELNLSQNRFRNIEDLSWSMKWNNKITKLTLGGYKYKAEDLQVIQQKTAENARAVVRQEGRKALLHALKHGASGPWSRCKLMVIGQGAAGKTATVRSLQGQPFVSEHISTIGVELAQTKIHTDNWQQVHAGETKYTAEFAAMRGIEEATKKRKKTGRGAPLPRGSSQAQLRSNKMKTKSTSNETKPEESPEQRLMDDEELHEYLGTSKMKRVDRREAALERLVVSAHKTKGSIVLTVWDYGGQTVFYNLHHVFLTRFGIYLLVFNMSEVLRDPQSCNEYLKFWLNSVALHAPDAPVVLVGTHARSMKSADALKVTRTVKELVGSQAKEPRLVGDSDMFAIDNKSGDGVDKLRIAVETTARGLSFVQAPVNIRWMQCLDRMLEDAQDKDKSWLQLQRVKEIARGVGVGDGEELDDMLSFFHELGVVLHFTGTESLHQMVITNPQWLINAITQVIRDDHLHGHDRKALQREGLSQDAALLVKNAIATRDLLNYFWGPLHTEFMLDLLTRMLLISRWTYEGDEETRERYLVPSLFKNVVGDPIDGIQCKYEFNYLPLGIFQRLVCLCLTVITAKSKDQLNDGSAESKPELHKHWAKMLFDGTEITLEELSESKSIVVTLSSPPYKAAPRIVGMMTSMLEKIRRDVMGTNLQWETRVETDKGSFVKLLQAIRNKVEPWYEEIGSSVVSGRTIDRFVEEAL